MAVPQWSGAPKDAPLTESSPLEPRTLERDSYCRAKLEAELLVSNAVREQHLPAVLLRPGLIFGGPLPLVSAAVARRVGGRYIVLGDGNVRPPFVYLDDVVDAVVSAIDHRLIHGEIVQIIDTDVPTQNEVLRKAHPDARVMHLPRLLVFALGKVSETILRGRSPFTLYRLRSALAKRTYVSESARLIGWEPSVGVSRGIDLVTTGASGGAGSGS
jgi:nucleoside-diphosphate-sugar epimerase